ncbi:hypothetical protein T01_12155 [Trichinella spiralis]|uniref:Uncharacterized protein n=2 Tax=Trichinella spiralis TaxID=6334 RepID=A0A0V1BDU6_TRISP|nr:hypothetical protein T01_12155 [Trichinella spiralis]
MQKYTKYLLLILLFLVIELESTFPTVSSVIVTLIDIKKLNMDTFNLIEKRQQLKIVRRYLQEVISAAKDRLLELQAEAVLITKIMDNEENKTNSERSRKVLIQ